MKQKLFSYLGFAGMLTSMLTGCGFVVEEEPLSILGITSQVLEDGQTMVVITYTDEEIPPTVFYLPKGQDGQIGKDGTGIASFDYKKDNYGNYDVEIKFTDDTIEPVKLKLTNGVSIANIGTKYNEEKGVTELIVYYSDGTSSEPLTLPKGDKGEDGVGIVGYEQISNEDGSSIMKYTFSNGEEFECRIPAPEKGVDGKGIAAIASSQTDTEYILIVTYTDNSTPQVIRFEKPSMWLFGSKAPDDVNDGKNGDFYYDTSKNTIYIKIEDRWVIQTDFDDVGNTYTVSFNLNAEDAVFLPGYGYQTQYLISDGNTFESSNKDVPIPYRQGYTFVGWYTSATPSVTHGTFTDLTPVISDMTLYAKWEQTTASGN